MKDVKKIIAMILALVSACALVVPAAAVDAERVGGPVTTTNVATTEAVDVSAVYATDTDTEVVVLDSHDAVVSDDVIASDEADTAELMAMPTIGFNIETSRGEGIIEIWANWLPGLEYADIVVWMPSDLTVEFPKELQGEDGTLTAILGGYAVGDISVPYFLQWRRTVETTSGTTLIATMYVESDHTVEFEIEPIVRQIVVGSNTVQNYATETAKVLLEVAEPVINIRPYEEYGYYCIDVSVENLPRDVKVDFDVSYGAETMQLWDYGVSGRLRVSEGLLQVTNATPDGNHRVRLFMQFSVSDVGRLHMAVNGCVVTKGDGSTIVLDAKEYTENRGDFVIGAYYDNNNEVVVVTRAEDDDGIAIVSVYDDTSRQLEVQIRPLRDFSQSHGAYESTFHLRNVDNADPNITCKVILVDGSFCPTTSAVTVSWEFETAF